MIKKLLLALSLTLLPLAAGQADTLVLSGNTTGAPTFVRPTETGARSFFAVPYNVYQFNVTTSGQFSFVLNAAAPANYDTFLHLFVGAFDPTDLSDPALNLLAANDDAVFGSPELGSGLMNANLISGTNYFFVVDGFIGSDAGAYTASITGPGAITIVPEPSTIALFTLSGLGLAAMVRRRRSHARA